MSFVAGFFCYFVHYFVIVFDHTYEHLKVVTKSNVELNRAGRIFGNVCSFFSSFVLMPAARTGIWVNVFAIPYERAIKYHRFFGVLMYVAVTLHALMFWAQWLDEGHLKENIFGYQGMFAFKEIQVYDDPTWVIVETSWFLMTLSIISIFFRRYFYTGFQYFHQAAGIIFYVAGIIHGWGFWYYAIGGLILWLCDRLSRGLQSITTYTPARFEWHSASSCTFIKLEGNLPKYTPGQYFMLNIPGVSINEWHPYSASASLDNSLIFYLRARPNSTSWVPSSMQSSTLCNLFTRPEWSARLADLAARTDQKRTSGTVEYPVVRMQGPYGHIDSSSHETLLLFGGGIGITPLIATYTEMRRRASLGTLPSRLRKVVLVWVTRNMHDFHMFEDVLLDAAACEEEQHRRQEAERVKGGWCAEGVTGESVVDETPYRSSASDPATELPAGLPLGVNTRTKRVCEFKQILFCTTLAKDGMAGSGKTSGKGVINDSLLDIIHPGRPCLNKVFVEHAHSWVTLAAVCGPASMLQEVSALAWQHGTNFHSEVFWF
eukprot:m.237486 g.237486  ORF g.237486 m.237486 type:complete len:545 (+) comp21154_c0_seq1:2555-4189(+)